MKSRTDNNKLEPFLFIQLKDKDGRFVQFQINEHYESEEMFTNEFIEQVEALRSSYMKDLEVLKKFEHSDRWQKIE